MYVENRETEGHHTAERETHNKVESYGNRERKPNKHSVRTWTDGFTARRKHI